MTVNVGAIIIIQCHVVSSCMCFENGFSGWLEVSIILRSSVKAGVHNRKRGESVTLVYHPYTKFNRGQLHANIISDHESARGQQLLSMCSQTLRSSVTLMVKYSVDLLWQMQFHSCVLTTLKDHEPLPGMIYSIRIC